MTLSHQYPRFMVDTHGAEAALPPAPDDQSRFLPIRRRDRRYRARLARRTRASLTCRAVRPWQASKACHPDQACPYRVCLLPGLVMLCQYFADLGQNKRPDLSTGPPRFLLCWILSHQTVVPSLRAVLAFRVSAAPKEKPRGRSILQSR